MEKQHVHCSCHSLIEAATFTMQQTIHQVDNLNNQTCNKLGNSTFLELAAWIKTKRGKIVQKKN